MRVDDLQAKLLDLTDRANEIQATAEAENRELTDEERQDLDNVLDQHQTALADIERLQRVAAATQAVTQAAPRKTPPAPVGGYDDADDARPQRPQAKVPAQPVATRDRRRGGFNHFGEFAVSVMHAANKGGTTDPRLLANAPSTWGSEGVGADGGFVVPPDFRDAIVQMVMGEDSLISRTDQQFSSSNSFSQPTDETTPWQTSGGIQAYWEGEAGQITQSKPAFQANTLRLHKLTALVAVTEELREDAPAIDSYLRSKAPEKIIFKINDAIVRGTGGGQPLGILNSPCLVSVAKETSQAADTLRAKNITAMWARMYAPYRSGAVWLINQDLEAELPSLGYIITTPDGTTAAGGAGLVYMPPGGLSAAPYGTILGRPVIPTEACSAIGDKGDIILAALPQYLTVQKIGGLRAEVSMHLWFDYDMSAFRFIMRVAGAPWLSAPISRAQGSNTLSSFVTLDAR